MALLRKQLYIKESTLPNAGKGLFTTKAIPKGTRIIEYTGKRSTWKEVKDDDGKNGYIFYINRNNVIDARPNKRAYARYANDARGLVRVKGIVNNSDYVVDGLKCYIESTKDIPAGAEIFVDYGRDYWKVIRQNMKQAKDRERQKSKRNGKVYKRNGVSHKVHGKAIAKRMQHH